MVGVSEGYDDQMQHWVIETKEGSIVPRILNVILRGIRPTHLPDPI